MREVVSERASGESLGFWEEFAQERAISVYSTPNKKIPHPPKIPIQFYVFKIKNHP